MRPARFHPEADDFRGRADAIGDADDPEPFDAQGSYDLSVAEGLDPGHVLIPVLRRIEFSFNGRANGEQTVIVANQIDTSFFSRGSLQVIVHTRVGWSATASLDLQVQNVSNTPDQPELTFVDTEVSMASLSITASSPATLPFFQVVQLSTAGMGEQMRVELRFNQGATSIVGAQTITLSVFILGRTR